MKQLNEHHSFTGMQRDMSISKHPSSFLYDAHNIRLTARGEDTLLTLTNERGPLDIGIEVEGTYLGHCLLGKYLVVFSTRGLKEDDNASKEDKAVDDYITRIDLSTKEKLVLYNGNLRFSTNNLIEAISSFENENVQKVYWTDGKNQPRVINIVGEIKENVNTQFDFIRELALQEEVTIQKQLGASGSFAPGVIQYAFTYYNKFGQETNIFYTSPLLYISHKDRGGSPEDKVENAFKITVKNLDKSFDFLRIYSIQRTSLNAVPIVKRIQDINIKELGNKAEFLDLGTSGDSVDPTELLYKGGESIVAQTIEQKDNTLFLGNIKTERAFIEDTIDDNIKNSLSTTPIIDSTRTIYPTPVYEKADINVVGYYYENQLTAYSDREHKKSTPCGGFKKGDYYRCGVQFQYKDGTWSDPIFIEDKQIGNKPSRNYSIHYKEYSIILPTLTGTITKENVNNLLSKDYKKARAVVVFPSLQDRVVLCQGVTCPTLYTSDNHDTNVLYGQSSWFFRPYTSVPDDPNVPNAPSPYEKNNGTDGVTDTPYWGKQSGNTPSIHNEPLIYMDRGTNDSGTVRCITNPKDYRLAEVQGCFNPEHQFKLNAMFLTMHSPEIEFDDSTWNLNFSDTETVKVGNCFFTYTMSDIDIQVETPTINSYSQGFVHKSFGGPYSYGIVAGLFYEDYSIDDADGKLIQWNKQHSPYKWLVLPWQRTGSITNDINRPSDKGTSTSVLKKKVISNLRYADTSWLEDDQQQTNYTHLNDPKVFKEDQLAIIKLGNHAYQGNIDTSLYPDKADGTYFAFDKENLGEEGINTPFNVNFNKNLENINSEGSGVRPIWRTYTTNELDAGAAGIYAYMGHSGNNYNWVKQDNDFGDAYMQLTVNKSAVRMRYKSTPHLVLDLNNTISIGSGSDTYSTLPIVEVRRKGDDNSSYYRSTMFGGTSEDAKKANIWIPCGEPVTLVENTPCEYNYSYGDTYFQRWDCLKTYPFSFDDINQIVEIGSFMLETRVNIDGRYDRNRNQVSNLNMSPINFNLFNPVYNQINNFFTYRILDKSYYEINSFPNQITWTKEKKAGADVDLWTNITLASTYDMDGSKGEIRSLQTWKDEIFCFQDLGISKILFNSRVQIPTSDGVPIEITNSYKVDGYRYISDGIGCKDKWTISNTPSGMYFADTKTNHLYHIADGMQDITTIHNMSSWFNDVQNNKVIKTLHDDVNHDLYVLTDNEALCYSEILGNFTSFMNYEGISLIETYGSDVFTMKDSKLYSMFKGEYNNFFDVKKPWNFTFISNGIENNLMDFDKIYSTIDYRMDMSDSTDYKHDNSLDIIRVYNEYQDTGEVDLQRVGATRFIYHKDSNLQKKFRIWRIQIPRDNKNGKSLNRIRNPWCKIKLGSKGNDNLKAILYDLNVQYYL